MATTKATELGQLGKLLSVDSSGVTITGLVSVGSIVGDGSGLTGVSGVDSAAITALIDSDYVRSRAAQFIQDTYVYSATAGQTVFTGLDDNTATLSYTPSNLLVQVNGVILLNGEDYTATDGNTITLTVPADSGDDVVVNAFSSFDVAFGEAFQQDYEYNATLGQTVFANSDQNGNVLNVNTQGTIVSLNGLTLRATDDYSITQTAVTLSVAADSGDEILIRTFKKLSVADTVSATNGGTFSNSITAKTVKAAQPFFVNSQTVSENFTIEAGTSAMAAGPVTINSGVTVSIASGSRWVIV